MWGERPQDLRWIVGSSDQCIVISSENGGKFECVHTWQVRFGWNELWCDWSVSAVLLNKCERWIFGPLVGSIEIWTQHRPKHLNNSKTGHDVPIWDPKKDSMPRKCHILQWDLCLCAREEILALFCHIFKAFHEFSADKNTIVCAHIQRTHSAQLIAFRHKICIVKAVQSVCDLILMCFWY